MNTADILKVIDEQIAHLQQARQLLVDSAAPAAVSVRSGRPKGSKNKGPVTPALGSAGAVKRVMSAEGKARIAAAQKLRWERQKAGVTTATSPAKTSVRAKKKAVAKPKAAKKIPAKNSATADA